MNMTIFPLSIDILVTLLMIFRTWADQAPPHTILRVFVCLRIMMRDTNYQQQFCDMSGVKVIIKNYKLLENKSIAFIHKMLQ